MKNFPFAPKKIYDEFTKYFPLATVDVVVFDKNSFILTKRAIPPYKGLWHLPGGIIRKGEKLESAAKRVVKKELNLDVTLKKFLGVYQNPVNTRHDITHCFIATIVGGNIDNDFQSNSVKFFKNIPSSTIPYHKVMIRNAIVLMKTIK